VHWTDHPHGAVFLVPLYAAVDQGNNKLKRMYTNPWSRRSASTTLRLAVTSTTVNVHTLPWSLTASQAYRPASPSAASVIVSVHLPVSVLAIACFPLTGASGSPSLCHVTRGFGNPRTCCIRQTRLTFAYRVYTRLRLPLFRTRSFEIFYQYTYTSNIR